MSNDAASIPPQKRSSYVVLRQDITHVAADDGATVWVVHATADANSAKEAIRKTGGEVEGTYVAVPSRSWDPLTVKIETTKIVHVG